MSTLAAARADNFYYPPEWTPEQGSLNKFHGQHPLRERARKLDQGILIIRFEMPFNVWCAGCRSMIAKGVRFNAEKRQVGKYYSTTIWSFKMKASCCRQEIEIQTDPQNCEYVIISGAERKTEVFDAEDAETLLLPSEEDRNKLADPFYRLEHMGEDVQKAKDVEPLLVRMQRASSLKHLRDYSHNKALRARLRDQKKRIAEEAAFSKKIGLGIRLLPPSAEDADAATAVNFAHKFEVNRRNKRAAIKASSIFSSCPTSGNKLSDKSLPSADSERRLHLLAKKRMMDAAAAQRCVIGNFRPSSKSLVSVSPYTLGGKKSAVAKPL
eukprot:c22369_g1_i1 orf=178-1152(+)